MSEIITMFGKGELPLETSKIEIKCYYGFGGGYSFEITCIHCKIKSDTPQLIMQRGHVLCPSCKREL